MDDNQLTAFLEGLTPADFARILARIPKATRYIPQGVSHLERVSALLHFVRSSGGPGIESLIKVVVDLFPEQRQFLLVDVPDKPDKNNAKNSNGVKNEGEKAKFRLVLITFAIIASLTVGLLPFIKPTDKTPPPTDTNYVGRIVTAETIKPIRGAKVSLQGQGVPTVLYSDSEGVFVFPLKDVANNVRIIVEADGYETYERRITPSVKNEPEDIRLKKSNQPYDQGKMPLKVNSNVRLVDVNTLGNSYEKVKRGDTTEFSPASLFAQTTEGFFYESVKTGPQQPLVLDFKLLNRGDVPELLKEIQIHVIKAQIDPIPIMNRSVWTTPAHDLVFTLRNRGWTHVHIESFKPISDNVASLLKLDSKKMIWSGDLVDNLIFVLPARMVSASKGGVISQSEVKELSSAISGHGFLDQAKSHTISTGRHAELDETAQKARKEYLSMNKGVSYDEFSGELSYRNNGGTMTHAELTWGEDEGFYDLLFADTGFYLLPLPMSPTQYVGPTHNYDITLSVNDNKKIKSINAAQFLEIGKPDRFTVSLASQECVIYELEAKLIFDTKTISSGRIRVKLFAINSDIANKCTTFVFNGTNWMPHPGQDYLKAMKQLNAPPDISSWKSYTPKEMLPH